MTDDTTVPMGGFANTHASLDDDDDAASAGEGGRAPMEETGTGQAGAGMGPYKDFSERRASTVLDEEERGRGRIREPRGRARPEPSSPSENALIEAAVAAEALMAAVTPMKSEHPGSLDSVRYLKTASPEKKQRTSKMPAFGDAIPVHDTRAHHPPLFHGKPPQPGQDAKATAATKPTGPAPLRPEVYDLEAQPSWLPDLQRDIKVLVETQKLMAQQMQTSGAELARIQDGISNLSVGQESLTRRADEQEAALEQMRREFRVLEKELHDVKSTIASRPVTPAQTPRASNGRSESPRFPSQREIDEFQIVIGGWGEAKRADVQSDVEQMFKELRATPLLQNVFVPYVRSSFCRVELVYVDADVWAKRKLQAQVLKHLQALGFKSSVPGQEHAKFWFARNRTPQERAKIRAVLSVQSLCVKYLGDALVERDWRGKIWASGHQILHHVDNTPRAHHTLMLTDAKGNETGWFLDVTKTATILGATETEVLKHFDAA